MNWVKRALLLPSLLLSLTGCAHGSVKVDKAMTAFQGKLAPEMVQAIAAGNLAKTRSLIQQGADINAVDDRGRSLLDFAFAAHRPREFELLLDSGADATLKAEGANSTVAHDATENKGGLPYLKMLLAHGVPVEVEGNAGMTPLFSALGSSIANAKFLIEHGANVNHRDSMGETPLIVAAMSGDYDGMLLLLHHGADPNIVDKAGKTFQGYLRALPEVAYTKEAQTKRQEIRDWLKAHEVAVKF